MVFPVETEERMKRRALSICQDHLRMVVGIVRKVPQLFEYFAKGDTAMVKHLHEEIRKGEEEIAAARHGVAQELAEVGAILMSRDDFLRFANLTSEIADFSEGIAYRLSVFLERGWNAPQEIKKKLVKLSEAVLDTVLKLRETSMTLQYGSAKTSEKANEVESAERNVDDLFRELGIVVISSKIEFAAAILLRDVLRLMEDITDKAEDAADVARLLSFAM